MIVVGVDVHKHSLTAVAVDELGRERDTWSGAIGAGLLAWARALDGERLWALEDCRHVTRGLERMLLEQDEQLVRVPPRLTAPQRRRGRVRGKSDRIGKGEPHRADRASRGSEFGNRLEPGQQLRRSQHDAMRQLRFQPKEQRPKRSVKPWVQHDVNDSLRSLVTT